MEPGRVLEKTAMGDAPAVTLTVSKRQGKNAVGVAERVMSKLDSLKGTVIPAGVSVTVTRNYGESARVWQNRRQQRSIDWKKPS